MQIFDRKAVKPPTTPKKALTTISGRDINPTAIFIRNKNIFTGSLIIKGSFVFSIIFTFPFYK